jgi:hypothetical protein
MAAKSLVSKTSDFEMRNSLESVEWNQRVAANERGGILKWASAYPKFGKVARKIKIQEIILISKQVR